MSSTLLKDSLGGFLDRIASRDPAPGGGAVAAVAVTMASSLVAMAARGSVEHGAEAHELVRRAEALRDKVGPLAQADGEAYGAVLDAHRLPAEPDLKHRKETIAKALEGAAGVPLEVAEAAKEVAVMAAELAEEGNPNFRGDAVTAALLAAAGGRAAAVLVAINLTALDPRDDRVGRAEDFASAAEAAARRALEATA